MWWTRGISRTALEETGPVSERPRARHIESHRSWRAQRTSPGLITPQTSIWKLLELIRELSKIDGFNTHISKFAAFLYTETLRIVKIPFMMQTPRDTRGQILQTYMYGDNYETLLIFKKDPSNWRHTPNFINSKMLFFFFFSVLTFQESGMS